MNLSIDFSNSSLLKIGLSKPSANISRSSGKNFDNEEPDAPVADKFKLAPIKSIFSINSSLETCFVPFPKRSDVTDDIPVFSPSKIGCESINRLKNTLGSLSFLTNINFNPFLSSCLTASPKLISGVGPDSGTLVLSTWLKLFKVNSINVVNKNFFIIYFSVGKYSISIL